MHWFSIHDLPKKRPPPGLFSGRLTATQYDVHAAIIAMFDMLKKNPRSPREGVWNWCQEWITESNFDEAAFFTLAYYADKWLSQREQNEYDLAYRREELRIDFLRRGHDPDAFEFYADGYLGRRAWPTIPKPGFQDVSLRYQEFKEDQRAWIRAQTARIRREQEEAARDRHAQAMHETLKEKARKDEAERRQVLLHRNQDRLAQARAAEREAEQRALDEKRRKEQAAAQRAAQKKQKDKERQQASSEVSGVSDDALRAILAEQEAAEKAAAAEGQGSSAWHASTAAPSPEEEARMRAEAEAAERERKAEKDDWIAKAAQKREAKQAKRGKGKGKAPAAAEPAPALPAPPRVDWDEAMANALQQRVQLQDRR